MTARQLMQLYPRSWRERYGDELVETIGPRPLELQHVIDLMMGAVDAWLSPEVRRATVRSQAAGVARGGHSMMQELKIKCATGGARYTTRDAIVSAAVMLAGTALLLAAGLWFSREDYPVLGDAVKSAAFPVAMMLAMPFALTKGQPRRAQIATTVVTVTLLALASWIATKI